MEDVQIILERHEQKILALEGEISDLKAVQTEIRSMNETLVTLATELKHTNEHLARHERKIDEIEGQPKNPHAADSHGNNCGGSRRTHLHNNRLFFRLIGLGYICGDRLMQPLSR